MDQSKNKFGRYFSEVFKKTGVLAPAFGAAILFLALFVIRHIGLFAAAKAANSLGYYLMLIASLIGIVLLVVYFVLKIKSTELVGQDSFLLTMDFLMIFLLVGTIIVDFDVLDLVYYLIALVAVVVFNVLRIMFFNPKDLIKKDPPAVANTGLKKYFDMVFDRFGMWNIILGAIGGFCTFALMAYALNIKEFFESNAAVAAGIFLATAIFVAVFILCYVFRVTDKRLAFLDGFTMFLFFTIILSGLYLFTDYNSMNLAGWLIALVLSFGLIYILAANTHNSEDQTSDDFFATDGGRKFAKNPKVYFKQFVKNTNVIFLAALAMFAFAIFDACAILNVFGQVSGTFMIYFMIALVIYFVAGLIYLGRGHKKPVISKQDGLLAILDVSLLLLIIPMFANLGIEGMMTSVIIWAMAFVCTIAFTIDRMFKVKSDTPIEEDVEKKDEN